MHFVKSYQLFFPLNVSGKACVCVWLGRYTKGILRASCRPGRIACSIGVRRERRIDGAGESGESKKATFK